MNLLDNTAAMLTDLQKYTQNVKWRVGQNLEAFRAEKNYDGDNDAIRHFANEMHARGFDYGPGWYEYCLRLARTFTRAQVGILARKGVSQDDIRGLMKRCYDDTRAKVVQEIGAGERSPRLGLGPQRARTTPAVEDRTRQVDVVPESEEEWVDRIVGQMSLELHQARVRQFDAERIRKGVVFRAERLKL